MFPGADLLLEGRKAVGSNTGAWKEMWEGSRENEVKGKSRDWGVEGAWGRGRGVTHIVRSLPRARCCLRSSTCTPSGQHCEVGIVASLSPMIKTETQSGEVTCPNHKIRKRRAWICSPDLCLRFFPKKELLPSISFSSTGCRIVGRCLRNIHLAGL